MEINFNVFLATLQRITFPTTTQTEISRILVIFQHEMSIHFFSPFTSNQYEYNTPPNEPYKDEKEKSKNKSVLAKQNDFDENLIIAPMKTIWQIFFESYRIQPSQIRLMISRSVGIYLTRIMPFYPDQLSQSFVQTIRCLSYNDIRSSLVISSFTFIAHELSPPLLNDFLSSCSNILIQIHPTGSRSLPSISSLKSSFSFFKTKDSSPTKSTIFDHFSISSNDLSEHIAPIIEKLGFLGHDWLHQLLVYFLDNVQPQPGRHTIHAILATINHYPKEFLKEAIEKLKEKNIRDYISIFALFFYNYSNESKAKWKIKEEDKIEENINSKKSEGCFLYDNEVDITCFIDIAFDILKEKNAQFIDDALQILTILSDLEVHLTKNNEKVEKIHQQTENKSILALDNDNDEDSIDNIDIQNMIITFNYGNKYHNIQVPATLLVYRSTFYRLSLPLSLLKPNKNENILVSSSKFHTLAYYAKEISNRKHNSTETEAEEYMRKINIDEITDIFHEVFNGEYNEFVSSAYQAISSCFKDGTISLYKDNTDTNDPTDFYMNMDVKLIRHILFCPMISWFHCIDVLKFIQTLNLNKIDSSLAFEIVGILIDFSLNKNAKLSNMASLAIMDFVTPDNCIQIIQKLIDRISLFDIFEMEKLLPSITNIIKRFGTPPEFTYFLNSVIEIIPYLKDNYKTISLIFDLITVSGVDDRNLLTEAIKQAYVYIVSSYELATGKNWVSKAFHFNEVLNLKKPLSSEIDLKNIDIITDPTDNIRTVFSLLQSSLNFAFTFEPFINIDFDLSICERCFELFPLETSEFIYKVISNYPDQKISLSHYCQNLRYVNNYKAFQIWCRILIKKLVLNEKEEDEDKANLTETQKQEKTDQEKQAEQTKSGSRSKFATPSKNDRKNKHLFVDKDEKYIETSSSGSGCGVNNNNATGSRIITEAISYLNVVIFDFFNSNNPFTKDLELIATFSVFSFFTYLDGKKKIIHILKSLPEDRLKAVLYYAKNNEPKGEILFNEFSSKFDENQINTNEYIHKQFSYPKFINFKFTLNKSLDPDTLLMLAIHSGSEKNVKDVLKYLKSNDLKIKIPESKMKPSISEIISKWLSKNQFSIKSNLAQSTQQLKINSNTNSSSINILPNSDRDETQSVPSFKLSEFKFSNDHVTFDTLIDALGYVSTEWKSVAVATIKKNSPDNLLFQLCSCEKVPKHLLLNLCKIVELVKFDKNKLFNVCNMLLYEAKTTKRQRITMRLFTTSMMYAEMIPLQIVNSFVSELGNLITTLPFYELTLCIKTIGKVIQNPIEASLTQTKAKEEPLKRKFLVPDVPNQSHPRIRRKSMFVKPNSSSDVINTNIQLNENSSSISIDDESSQIALKKANSDNKIRRKYLENGSTDFDSSDYDLFNINKTIYNLQETSDFDDILSSSCENFDLHESSLTSKQQQQQQQVPPPSFMQFAQKVRRKLNPTNYLYGNLQIFFFQFTKPETSIIYAMDEEDNLVHYLETTIPSKFLIGMRQFSMRLKTMTNFDSDRFVKNIGRTILGKVFDFIELPFFTHLLMEGVIKPLIGSGHWYYLCDTICRTLAKVSFAAPHYMAIYPSILKWLPLGIRTTSIPELYPASSSLFEEVSNPKAFSLGIQCLIEKLTVLSKNFNQYPDLNEVQNPFDLGPSDTRTADEKKDELLMDSVLVFLENIERNDSMYLTEYLMDLAAVISRFSQNNSFMTMVFTQFYKKSPRFFPAFAALVKFIQVSPESEAIPIIKESIIQITDSDLKRRAVKLLNDNTRVKEALVLAQNADKIFKKDDDDDDKK